MKKPTLFGKYFLLDRINVGGMAEVFRAKAFGVEGFERLVAVKRILPNLAEDDEFIRMFIEEAKLAVQLNHANIAQIFDLGVVDGAYFIALEYVHGRDLRGIFDRCRQFSEAMPVAQACFVAMKVCEGLDYAHNKRDQGRPISLVHRDVSPQNILVSFEGEVKLIDFGVAKAAGTGAATQAGVLKGKFGYMSPEQVRGLPVDRRSDVFSCGIVLYELLTGERLFVGESDYSTLEKVRNVEILPPSTYNRKIPDELERIVLKALAKDVADRYQNAIDLHDELQAFVYTAGEFYSRKDLAGWMKKTFGKEIEEETAKIEGYRELKQPGPHTSAEAVPAVSRSSITKSSPVRKPTQSVPVVKQPPPPPIARSQPVPIAQVAISASAPAPSAVSKSGPVPAPPTLMPSKGPRPHRPAPSSWDDDDLETRVYDDDDARHKPNRASLPLQPPVSSSPAISLAAADPGYVVEPVYAAEPAYAAEPPEHLAVEIEAEPAWDPADTMGQATLKGAGGLLNGAAAAPTAFPAGSNNAAAPALPDPRFDPRTRGDSGPVSRELPAAGRVSAAESSAVPDEVVFEPPSQPIHYPVTLFGAQIAARRNNDQRRSLLLLVIGGAAIATISIIIAILLSGGSKPPVQSSSPPPAPPRLPPAPPPVAAADPSTGFDLYVSPAGVSQWKLDGELRTDRLPSRIRGISVGPHTVQIDPPPGFMSQNQQIAVELGKAPKIEITLSPITGITGTFESSPPGASVSLIVDGKRQPIGPSPAKAPLDPRSTYQVLFEKPGYVSVNRPLAFSGGLEEHVAVNLEKTDPEGPDSAATPNPAPAPPSPAPAPPSPAPAPRPSGQDRPNPVRIAPPVAPRPPPRPQPPHRTPRSPDKVPDKVAPDPDPAPEAPDKAPDAAAEPKEAGKGQGVLVLGSKPPCEIAIDGSATGLHTPQKEIKLSAGRHRITLTNSEFSIKDTFTVDIKADGSEKLIKDYSDKLPD